MAATYQYAPYLPEFQSIDAARRWFALNMKESTTADLWEYTGPDGVMLGTMLIQDGEALYLPRGKILMQTVRKDGSLVPPPGADGAIPGRCRAR